MDDIKHRFLVNEFIKFIINTGLNVDVIYNCIIEHEYNHYGQRGFIDLVVEQEYDNNELLSIYEMKTILNDIGGLIRQIKKIKNNATYNNKSFSSEAFIITYFNEKNINII
ncbi:unnamed protein product, partial [marine sediment metagenome]